MRFATTTLAFLGLLALAGCATPLAATASCDRLCLSRLMDRTIADLQTGQVGAFQAIKLTENGAAIRPAASELRLLKSQTYRQFFADPTSGAAGFFGSGLEADRPVIFAVRIRARGGVLTEVETVVAHAGEASAFSPQAMIAPKPAWDAVLPPERRTPRAAMIAAAEAYFDGIEAADGSKTPVTPGCGRYENGAQLAGEGKLFRYCNSLEALDYIKAVRDRRYPLVDEERGLVWGIAAFNIPGGPYVRTVGGESEQAVRPPRSLLVAELFKIDSGRIDDIVVVMRNLPLGGPTGWP